MYQEFCEFSHSRNYSCPFVTLWIAVIIDHCIYGSLCLPYQRLRSTFFRGLDSIVYQWKAVVQALSIDESWIRCLQQTEPGTRNGSLCRNTLNCVGHAGNHRDFNRDSWTCCSMRNVSSTLSWFWMSWVELHFSCLLWSGFYWGGGGGW